MLSPCEASSPHLVVFVCLLARSAGLPVGPLVAVLVGPRVLPLQLYQGDLVGGQASWLAGD